MAWKQLGKGYLNPNEQATTDNKQPHWKGTVDFEDRPISIAGWVSDKGGKPSMFFTFSEEEKKDLAKDIDLPF